MVYYDITVVYFVILLATSFLLLLLLLGLSEVLDFATRRLHLLEASGLDISYCFFPIPAGIFEAFLTQIEDHCRILKNVENQILQRFVTIT